LRGGSFTGAIGIMVLVGDKDPKVMLPILVSDQDVLLASWFQDRANFNNSRISPPSANCRALM
jgi:hypothetical protein